MATSTYEEVFRTALEEWIKGGGDVAWVVMLVNMYQHEDAVARELTFKEWVEGRHFLCRRCRAKFAADSEVQEDEEILCAQCRRKGQR